MSRPISLTAQPSGPLTGEACLPGDKSISHRALIIAGLTVGPTMITGLLESADVLATAKALHALGVQTAREGEGAWRIHGSGVSGLAEPETPLDFGNSGTGVRLMMGAVGGQPIRATFTGDDSLRARPMARVLEPLARMGIEAVARSGDRLPLTLTGAARPIPITYPLPVPSAQVKSAILLAGLAAPGHTVILEAEPTRDHTERMLRHAGAQITVEEAGQGFTAITLTGQPELVPIPIAVPGDPSSAAFPCVAALLVPGSDILLKGVMTNALRFGLYETLAEMGAAIDRLNPREEGGESVADLRIRSSTLKGVEVPPERAPAMIDEYPALAVAAAFAEGRTRMRGLAELRVKESDRMAAITRGLRACGVKVEEEPDALIVHGCGPDGVAGGGRIATYMDHRIAMAFLTLGLAAKMPVTVDDVRMIETSFPGFAALLEELGAGFRRDNA